MKKHELAVQKLFKEYTDIAGLVVADYFLRIKVNEEIKKSIEASDFMNALLTGKLIKEEWSLDKSENYKKMQNLAETINFLQENQ